MITTIAWISALSIDACLLIRAFRITRTFWRGLQYYSLTFTIYIWYVQFWTFANHGTHWNRIQYGALGRPGTRFQFPARIDTLIVDTCQPAGTLRIHRAFRFVLHYPSLAVRERITIR